MSFRNHPLFLLSALILFFPIGLIFLLSSTHSNKKKWALGIIGFILFPAILSIAFLNQPHTKTITDYQIYTTRNKLIVGQSGGLIVASNNAILTDYTVTAESDNLSITNNVYTAQKIGESILTVTIGTIEKSVKIEIIEGDPTNEKVYLSPTGIRYHKTSTHAGKNAVEMTEEDALQSGKTPCLICYKK